MSEIPQSIIDRFFEDQGIRNLVINDYGYTSQLAAHGDFGRYTGKELAVYRLAVLLSILEGTYVNDPKLGVNLIRYIFKPMTEDNINAIQSELEEKIETYEKDLRLLKIETIRDTTYKSLYFRLHLKYVPTDSDIVLDFDFVKDIQALMLRST